MARIAAVDFGLKRIGLAISDERRTIALPLDLVHAGKTHQESVRAIKKALGRYELEKILVGLPLLMKGIKGEMAQKVEQFAEILQKELNLPVECVDERLTTAQADRALKELDYNRKERTKMVDSTSATLLLQAYLDRKSDIQ